MHIPLHSSIGKTEIKRNNSTPLSPLFFRSSVPCYAFVHDCLQVKEEERPKEGRRSLYVCVSNYPDNGSDSPCLRLLWLLASRRTSEKSLLRLSILYIGCICLPHTNRSSLSLFLIVKICTSEKKKEGILYPAISASIIPPSSLLRGQESDRSFLRS